MRLVRRALDGLLIALVVLILAVLVLGRVVPFFGGTTLVVAGPSMGSAVPIGAAIVATPVNPRDLAVGDIVSMRIGTEHAVFTHRVVRIAERAGEVWLETAGDANPEPDPAITPASSVIGRVGLVLPNAGYLLALLSTVSGLAFVFGLASFLVAGAWLLDSIALETEPGRRRSIEAGDAVLAPVGDRPVPVP